MLGDTLSTSSTTGPLGSLTNSVGGKVLVPVVSLVENTTGNLGKATGLGNPVNGVLDKVGATVTGLGGQVASAGGTGNPVTTIVGGALTGVGGVLDKSGVMSPQPVALRRLACRSWWVAWWPTWVMV